MAVAWRKVIAMVLSAAMVFGAAGVTASAATITKTGPAEWVSDHGGSKYDTFYSSIQTSDGGYASVGISSSRDGDLRGSGGKDNAVIAKFNASGKMAWMKSYGGNGTDEFKSLVQTSDGGFVAVGSSTSTGGDVPDNKGLSDFMIAKFNASGNKVWIKTHGGNGGDELNSVIPSADGGYIAAGYCGSDDGDLAGAKSYERIVFVKFDARGEIVWIKKFGNAFDRVNSIIQAPGGGYVAVGEFDDSFLIAKIDENGNILWHRTYGGQDYDELKSVALSSDGGFVAAGSSSSHDGDVPGNNGNWYDPNEDFIIAKFDASGNKVWIKNYGGKYVDWLESVVQAPDGGYVVAGSGYSWDGDLPKYNDSSDSGAVLLKVDSSGKKEWVKRYIGYTFFSVINLAGGGYLASGKGENVPGNKGDMDFVMAKVDAAGDLGFLSSTIKPIPDKRWTGKPLKPAVTVKLKGKTLKRGTDYTVSYRSNKAVGMGTVVLKGKGKYGGTKKIPFAIVPQKLKIVKASAGKRSVKVTWKKANPKQNIGGYVLQYRVKGSKKWLGGMLSKKLSHTVKKLKEGKRYEVRVRAYKVVKHPFYGVLPVDAYRYNYGPWSKIKRTGKVKK
jgi:hypothetical protein